MLDISPKGITKTQQSEPNSKMKCACALACEDEHPVQWVQPWDAENRVQACCLLCGAGKQEHLCVGAALIL